MLIYDACTTVGAANRSVKPRRQAGKRRIPILKLCCCTTFDVKSQFILSCSARMYFVIPSAVYKQTVNALLFLPCTFLSHLLSQACFLKPASSVSAKIRVTGTMTAEGVTFMELGTLPCSVLVHYSIISQWSPRKSELCSTRGEVPYGTSHPEKQRVAKDPQSPTSQLLQGPPSPSLIDFNNRLQGAECSHSLGWWGFSQVPQRTLQHLELFVWIALSVCGSQTSSVTQSDTYSMSQPFTHSLAQTFVHLPAQ